MATFFPEWLGAKRLAPDFLVKEPWSIYQIHTDSKTHFITSLWQSLDFWNLYYSATFPYIYKRKTLPTPWNSNLNLSNVDESSSPNFPLQQLPICHSQHCTWIVPGILIAKVIFAVDLRWWTENEQLANETQRRLLTGLE